MNRKGLLVLCLVLLAAAAFADRPPTDRVVGPVFMTGLEDGPFQSQPVTPQRAGSSSLDDPIFSRWQIGTTWYDIQGNGTFGKQIAVDTLGNVHFVFTKALDAAAAQRHVYYNVFDPAAQQFLLPTPDNPEGVRVNSGPRAGFCNVTAWADGWGFPVFHQTSTQQNVPHSVAGIDYLPITGAFTVDSIRGHNARQIIWPHVDIDGSGVLHSVSTENGGASGEFYSKGTPVIVDGLGENIDWGTGFVEFPNGYFITIDVAASWRSNRVAVAWIENTRDLIDNDLDVYVRISDDGGDTWGDPINITQFAQIDTNCVTNGGEIDICNQDTLRPWLDLSVLIDERDVVHVAFTAHAWYYWDVDGVPGGHGYVYSGLWHWDTEREEFNIMAEAFYGPSAVVGVNNLMCQRPSLGIDTLTGRMYCSYMQFDSLQTSAGGYAQADAWLTMSEDHGRTWAQGMNISMTDGGVDQPSPDCRHERDISIAKFVSNNKVHMMYQLDHDAGSGQASTPEGVPTLNELYYVAIPVDSIPARPLINPYRNLRADSTGYPWGLDTTVSVTERPLVLPGQFALYQNYPNPFNPSTRIQFDLGGSEMVTLKVYDVLGREVASLLDGTRLAAGAHVIHFDASVLPSGVYLYRLETATASQTRKMVLVK